MTTHDPGLAERSATDAGPGFAWPRSDEMPALMATFWRVVPFWASSIFESSNAFRETCRLTNFSSKT